MSTNRQTTHSILPQAAWDKFDAVETYLVDALIPQDDTQISTLRKNEEVGLDAIDVSPVDGKFLYLLAKMNKVKRILEVGTLGGYSAIVSRNPLCYGFKNFV
jgi:predicted O-methyltransferase YrrM